MGYRAELNRLEFPLEVLDRAMQALCASVRKSEEPQSIRERQTGEVGKI